MFEILFGRYFFYRKNWFHKSDWCKVQIHTIVWVGTGEANVFRSSMAGAGIYKSEDAGETWTHMGLTGTHTIPRIQIHPTDPNIVYVAASGHEWTHNKERGVYKTDDGGISWHRILNLGTTTGCIDLVMDPENPELLIAAMWNRTRERWSDPVPGPGDGIYKSTNGGDSWYLKEEEHK